MRQRWEYYHRHQGPDGGDWGSYGDDHGDDHGDYHGDGHHEHSGTHSSFEPDFESSQSADIPTIFLSHSAPAVSPSSTEFSSTSTTSQILRTQHTSTTTQKLSTSPSRITTFVTTSTSHLPDSSTLSTTTTTYESAWSSKLPDSGRNRGSASSHTLLTTSPTTSSTIVSTASIASAVIPTSHIGPAVTTGASGLTNDEVTDPPVQGRAVGITIGFISMFLLSCRQTLWLISNRCGIRCYNSRHLILSPP